jgi:hypothetical protein
MIAFARQAFTSPNGAPLRHSNFYRRVWRAALKLLGCRPTLWVLINPGKGRPVSLTTGLFFSWLSPSITAGGLPPGWQAFSLRSRVTAGRGCTP